MIRNTKDACYTCKGSCWGCFYADDCNRWQDIAPYNPAQIVKSEIFVALCDGRHNIPEASDGAIFGKIDNPVDFGGLYNMCSESLGEAVRNGVKTIHVYVTGLTSAMLTLVNYARDNNLRLITYNYDKNTGEYRELPIR